MTAAPGGNVRAHFRTCVHADAGRTATAAPGQKLRRNSFVSIRSVHHASQYQLGIAPGERLFDITPERWTPPAARGIQNFA